MSKIKTTFSSLRVRCGLSQSEAADFLGTRLESVKSWDSGRNLPPMGVIEELVRLDYKLMEDSKPAIEILEKILAKHGPDASIVEIGVSSSNEEARQHGYPSMGAEAAMLAWVVVDAHDMGLIVQFVPRNENAQEHHGSFHIH